MGTKVSVCVITYNHDKYISQSFDGILSQRVNFDYEIVVGEDCSIDKTREVCVEYKKKYQDKFVLLLPKKNIGMMNNFYQALETSKGKYIALCEGDDYWTDEYKLQKQVDFLEAHPDYAMACTDYDVLYQTDSRIEKDYLKNNFGYTEPRDVELEYYINKRKYIRTLTACFRRDLYKKYESEIDEHIRNNKAAGDLPIWLYFLATSKVKYIPDSTAVYRVSPNTASRIQDRQKRFEFAQTINGILDYYASKYKLSKCVIRQVKTSRIMSKMVYDFFQDKTFEIFKGVFSLIMIRSKSKQAIYFLLGSMNKQIKNIAVKKYDLDNYFN